MPPPNAQMTVEFRSATAGARLRISVLERDSSRLPSVRVQVEAELEGFAGQSTAWIEGDALREFMKGCASWTGVGRVRWSSSR